MGKKTSLSVFLLQVGHEVNQPIFDVWPRIRPPASPTKLARATIRRTVVVLKMTKVTKKGGQTVPNWY